MLSHTEDTMTPEDVVEATEETAEVEAVETEGPSRDENGRFAAKDGTPETAEPIEGEEGAEPVATEPVAETEPDWKPFTVKLHGEDRPLDWAKHLDGDNGGVYILPADIPKFHQHMGYAEAYQKSRNEIAQSRRQVVELERQLKSRAEAPNEEVAAATVLLQRIQKLTALDAEEVAQFDRDPHLYFRLLTRDALDAGKDAKLKAYETARTESTTQWQQEDTETLQTENLQSWVYHLRDESPELKGLTDDQLNDFIDEVMPAKGAYFVKDGNELKIRNDLLFKQLGNRARLLTDAQTRAAAASAAKRQNDKVLNKGQTPPTVPAKGAAVVADAQKKPKSREEWRARVGIA